MTLLIRIHYPVATKKKPERDGRTRCMGMGCKTTCMAIIDKLYAILARARVLKHARAKSMPLLARVTLLPKCERTKKEKKKEKKGLFCFFPFFFAILGFFIPGLKQFPIYQLSKLFFPREET